MFLQQKNEGFSKKKGKKMTKEERQQKKKEEAQQRREEKRRLKAIRREKEEGMYPSAVKCQSVSYIVSRFSLSLALKRKYPMEDQDLMEEEKALGKAIKTLPQPIPMPSANLTAAHQGSLLSAWYFANTHRSV